MIDLSGGKLPIGKDDTIRVNDTSGKMERE